MAELVDAADSKSVFERSGSSSLPRGTKIQKKPTLWSVFLCLSISLCLYLRDPCRSGLVPRKGCNTAPTFCAMPEILDLLRSPFAAQGRSYKKRASLADFELVSSPVL